MLRAMDSAVSGLRAHQQKLDVIGHNIANVNTVGFKSQSYTFKDTMYQSSTASSAGAADAGGVNAAQFGYGSLMGTISMDMTASTPTYVGGFAATIDGDGFFVTKSSRKNKVTNLSGTAATDTDDLKIQNYDYTRVGQFRVDSNGYIVDGQGNFLYGFRNEDSAQTSMDLEALRLPQSLNVAADGSYTLQIADDDDPTHALKAGSIEINKMGEIRATLEYVDGTDTKTGVFTIGTVAIMTFQNQEGLTKDGNGYYKSSDSDNTGICAANRPGVNATSTLMPGYLEASNVDMAVEFSEMIMAERGFQANSKIITVSDEILSDLINMKR